jgi:hypothetical protein
MQSVLTPEKRLRVPGAEAVSPDFSLGAVILSAAKDLALSIFKAMRDSSSPLLLCRNSTRKSLEFSRRSADLFFRSAARPRWTRKSRGPKKQVRATLPRPEFLPILGSRKAVNAQNDSAGEFFRSLFSPALPAFSSIDRGLHSGPYCMAFPLGVLKDGHCGWGATLSAM